MAQRNDTGLKGTSYRTGGDIDGFAARVFSCTIESLQCAAGEIIVLRVAGDVDLCTIPILYSALDKCLGQCAAYLVVDLTRVTFCSAHGLDLLIQTRRITTATATGYAVTGVPAHIQRFWILGWSGDVLPIRYHSTAAALTAIRAIQPVTA